MPKITVIIPVYNAEKYIEESVGSVLNQTFKNFELLIVNDSSTDNTEKIVKKIIMNDSRCFLINLPENKGKAHALNIAIQKAKGEFICILDADDIFFQDKLEQQIKFMQEHPEVDMVYGGAKYFSDSDEELEQRKILESSENLFENLKKARGKTIEELNAQHHGILNDNDAIIAACSVMIRKKVFEKCKFDEQLRNIEDYDMWYQIIGKGFKLYGIKKPFYYYRVHKNQKSANPEKRQIAKNIIFKKILSGEYFNH